MYKISSQKFIRDLAKRTNSMPHEELEKEAQAIVREMVENFPRSFFNMFAGEGLRELKEVLFARTKFLETYFKPNTSTRCYYFINGLTEIVKCETCGKPYAKQISPVKMPEFFHCNTFCAQRNPKVMAKIDETKTENGTHTRDLLERTKARNREEYGVDWYVQTDEFKDKSKAKSVENYGVDHPMKSSELREEMADRYEERHGVRYAFQDPEVQAKSRATMNENHGCDYPSQNPEICAAKNQKAADTSKRAFYRDVICNYPTVIPLFDEDYYVENKHEYDKDKGGFMFEWRCRKCGRAFEQRMFMYHDDDGNAMPRCLKCDPLIYQKDESEFEKEVREVVKFHCGGWRCEGDARYVMVCRAEDNRGLISSSDGAQRELDILLKVPYADRYEIAIEANGIYYHNTEHKPAGYHLEKTMACEALGVRLIHLWEDDWLNRREETEKFLVDAIMGRDDLPRYVRDDDRLWLPRDRFGKAFAVPAGWNLAEEVPPSVVRRSETRTKKPMDVEDCGYLVYERK